MSLKSKEISEKKRNSRHSRRADNGMEGVGGRSWLLELAYITFIMSLWWRQMRGSLRMLMCEFAHQTKELKLKHRAFFKKGCFLIELSIVAVKQQKKVKSNRIKHSLSGMFQHMASLSLEEWSSGGRAEELVRQKRNP